MGCNQCHGAGSNGAYGAAALAYNYSNAALNPQYSSTPQNVSGSMQRTATMYDFLKEVYERRTKNPRYQARVLERAQQALDEKHLPLESRLSEGAIIHEDGTVEAAAKDKEEAMQNVQGAAEVKERYQRFLRTKTGKGLDSFLTYGKGLKSTPIKEHGYVDLDYGTVAAILTNGKESAFLAGKDYWDQIKGTAMELYVMTHETTHSYGVRSEQQTDRIGKEYWTQKAMNAKTKEGREVYSLIAKKFEEREYTGKADWNELMGISLEYIRKELELEGDRDYAKKQNYGPANMVYLNDYKKHMARRRKGSIDDKVAGRA